MTTAALIEDTSAISPDEKCREVTNNGTEAISTAPVKELIFERHALAVAKCLVTSRAYGVMFSQPADTWLKWKNGTVAPVYCNCRALNRFALERKLVTMTLVECVKQNFPDTEVVVGMSTAGIAWGRVVADELDLPFAYVRNHAKSHGTARLVEGEPPTGKTAVIIDDLVASGGSILGAISALRDEAQIVVTGVQSIVNWGFRSMWRNLAGYRVKSLTSYPCILTNALRHGLINGEQGKQLLEFYEDPIHFKWPQLDCGSDPYDEIRSEDGYL